MSKFTLLLRESDGLYSRLSPAEMQAVVARYGAWSQGLREAGKLVGSQKLHDGAGRVVSRSNGRVLVSDGPHVEAKEVIGGMFVVEAATYDEAVTIANGCPHLDFGTIEVREVEILR